MKAVLPRFFLPRSNASIQGKRFFPLVTSSRVVIGKRIEHFRANHHGGARNAPARAPNEAAFGRTNGSTVPTRDAVRPNRAALPRAGGKARSTCQAVRAGKTKGPGLGSVSEKPGPQSLIARRACPKFGTQQARPGRVFASPATNRGKQARRASPLRESPTARRAGRLQALRFPRAPRARSLPWRCA